MQNRIPILIILFIQTASIIFKIDQFPFTNYPMYSKINMTINGIYKTFIICDKEKKIHLKSLSSPISAYAIKNYIFNHKNNNDPLAEKKYYNVLTASYNDKENVVIKPFFLDLNKYYNFILEKKLRYSEEIKYFNRCRYD